MIAENLSCNFLKIAPQSFETGYNTGTLKELQVTASYNQGTEVTKNINLTTLLNLWKCTFKYAANVYVKQVYVRNIFTNQLFPLIANPVSYIAGNYTALYDEIETTLRTTLNISNADVTGSAGIITVAGLPYNIVMDSVVTTLLSVESSTPFGFTSNTDIVINNDSIYILPSFFDLTSFVNGIYSITAILTTTANVLIEERACLFVDCTLGAALHKLVDEDKCDTHSMHLLLMHYTLKEASNGNCNCSDMYSIFDYLSQNINQEIITDCGCN